MRSPDFFLDDTPKPKPLGLAAPPTPALGLPAPVLGLAAPLPIPLRGIPVPAVAAALGLPGLGLPEPRRGDLVPASADGYLLVTEVLLWAVELVVEVCFKSLVPP